MAQTVQDDNRVILSHALLLLFSLGYLGTTARTCATTTCNARISIMISIGALSTLLTIALAIVLLIRPSFLNRFECLLNAIVLSIWTAALTLTMTTVGDLYTPLASSIAAFAWVSEALALVLLVSALFSPGGPLAPRAPAAPDTSGPIAIPSNTLHAVAFERDAVPEACYMSGTPDLAARTDDAV